jgi:hypothetical protein
VVHRKLHNRKLTEILVERNQDALFAACCFQHRFIARVRLPSAAPVDVMATRLKFSARSAPDARVE